jgi:hypothetical protein
MANPVPPLTYAMLFAAFTAFIQGGAAILVTLADCTTGQDVIDGGCIDVVDQLFEIVLFGTIPGAPLSVNILFGTYGIAARLTIIVWIIEQGWVAILVATIIAGIGALVAWFA